MTGRAGLLLVFAAGACGVPEAGEREPAATFRDLSTVLVEPGRSMDLPIVGEGRVPELVVAHGALPDGVTLVDGRLGGIPTTPGQLAQFVLEIRSPGGRMLASRAYRIAVGVASTTLGPFPEPTRTGDVISFHHDWGRPLTQAWGYDATLGLVWPLRVGAGFTGGMLAPVDGQYEVVVAGPGVQGRFQRAVPPADERLGTVAQLTWDEDVDVELVLLPEDAFGSGEVSQLAPVLEQGGKWLARHELAEAVRPGPEVIALSRDVPAGRWELVALKRAGTPVEIGLWLSVRTRDGEPVADEFFPGLFSDAASGGLAAELTSGRQSFLRLGAVVTDGNGTVTWSRTGARTASPIAGGR